MDLLIDNCTLLQLIYSEGYSQQLIELENYVNDGNIILLTHQLILDEWEKNKPIDKKRKLNKLLKQQNNAVIENSSLLPSPIAISQDHIDIQYEQLDKLLKKATLIGTYETIKNEFADRFRLRKAPFHHKLDSQNDWEIIGSAAHYCEISGIKNLFFASSNYTDFASADDKDRTIHPDIQDRFLKVDIVYFRDISSFLYNLKQAILPDKYLTYNVLKNEKFTHKASIRKNDLDSLYNLFKNIYEEIPFIPPHILRKYHPFSNPTSSYTYFSLFSLYNCRESLYELFTQIEIKDNNLKIINEPYFVTIQDYHNKLEYVLLALTNNLIFNIGSEKGNKRVNIHYTKSDHCDCVRCTFLRFEFHKSLSHLKIPPSNKYEQLKQAYINYQFGNYTSAYKQLLKLKDEAHIDKKYIIYYLCQYNLRHIGRLLSNPFYDCELTEQQVKAITEIDPIEECVKYKSRTDYDLLSFIVDGDFFKEAFETISELVIKIEDNYYSHLRGGWSSNSYVWKLIEEFGVLESFINKNFIIYDAYSNFDRLFELVIKGLFASHAMRGTDNSHLEKFDDYWVNQFVFYGSKTALFKYYKRFNLKGLAYDGKGQKNGSFLNIASNFLNNEKATKKAFNQVADKGNNYFYSRFNKIFDNLLTIATILQISIQDINRFGKILLKFIKTEASINNNGFESIANFVEIQGKFFSKSLLISFTNYFLANFDKYNPSVAEALLNCYEDNALENYNVDLIIDLTFHEKDATKLLDFLIVLYQKSGPVEKLLIAKAINNSLQSHFNFRIYYYALINDIIELRKNELDKLLNEIDINKQEHSFKSVLSGAHNKYISRLDDLINLYFKFGINTKSQKFQRFRQRNQYYDWLLDMDGFNYDNFDFEWTMHYTTKFYYRAMSKSNRLKEVLINYLRTTSHPALEKVLLKITYYIQ